MNRRATQRLSFALLSAAMIAPGLLGCARQAKPYRTAPVAGVITLDGQPLSGAHIAFLPQHDAQAGAQSGPEAAGDTDAAGRYSLKTVFGDTGATIGKNRVMVSTRKTELDPRDPDRVKTIAPERIPNKYFTEQAPLYFDVTPEGSAKADFDLTSK